MNDRRPRRLVSVTVAVLVACASAPAARAFDPATTHAGLTEQAVFASSLHRVLSRRLGRPLGLLEPLQINSRLMNPQARRVLWARFGALDPAGGYRPGTDGQSTAMSWVVTGAVLAKTPPERGRNHFFDPIKRTGLHDDAGLSGAVHVLRLAVDGGAGLRQLATGTAFDLTGEPSLAWLDSPRNDQGLAVFTANLEQAVAASEPATREAALVQALLSVGGILAVLEDAGDPAHVRNDFRATFLAQQSASPWDQSSGFERYVAAHYGRSGVPRPASGSVRRPSLEAFFTAADGQGLADRANRGFFSEGTVPQTVYIDAGTTTRDVTREARESLRLPLPTVARLELRQPDKRGYVMLEGRRTLAYERTRDRVRFFLDSAVMADSARALLPQIGAYAAGLVDHLFRQGLVLSASGRQVSVAVEPGAPDVRRGTLRIYAEDGAGIRRELQSLTVDSETFNGNRTVTVEAPAGIVRIAAALRGEDAAGPCLGVGELALP